jgi:hypothetical protein
MWGHRVVWYPNDIDRSLNEVVVDKIRKYHIDYDNNPPYSISFIPCISSGVHLVQLYE